MSEILDTIRFRRAGPGDAQALSSLAFRSKAHWGYDIDFMKRCKAELTYSPDDIEAPRSHFHLGEIDGKPVTFYGLELLDDGRVFGGDADFMRPAAPFAVPKARFSSFMPAS